MGYVLYNLLCLCENLQNSKAPDKVTIGKLLIMVSKHFPRTVGRFLKSLQKNEVSQKTLAFNVKYNIREQKDGRFWVDRRKTVGGPVENFCLTLSHKVDVLLTGLACATLENTGSLSIHAQPPHVWAVLQCTGPVFWTGYPKNVNKFRKV